jgi:hypothetical protein
MALISIAQDEVIVLKKAPFEQGGIVDIIHATEYGTFTGVFSGTAGVDGIYTPTLVRGAATVTGTKDNSATLNLYRENGEYKLQNKITATKNLLIEYRASARSKSDL